MDPTTWHSGHVTLTEKKHALCALQETIRYCRTPEALTHSTSRLVACFSSDPQVIQQCCDLLAQLMTKDGFTVGLAGDALGRFLRYLPLFFMCEGNGGAKERMVAGLAKLIQRNATTTPCTRTTNSCTTISCASWSHRPISKPFSDSSRQAFPDFAGSTNRPSSRTRRNSNVTNASKRSRNGSSRNTC
uniref:(northern house mosquito) hypothetical protein n=1 Tax=Culex pipiens TaxID=7175 RepID=A0A8D8MT62_CULPI